MKQQQTILTPGPLLDEKGHLQQAGYATSLVKTYDRSAIRAGWHRIKEWDYYLVICPRYAVALTIADNGYMGLDSISLLDFSSGFQHTNSPMRILTLGKTGLPATSVKGDVSISGKGYRIRFENDGARRRLTAHMDNFKDGKAIDIDVTLTDVPRDSMVIATPFPGAPKAFYYNQKINCLTAEGKCTFGDETYLFDPAESTAVLDWGRGVWTYKNTWYWGSGNGWQNGRKIGWNLGYGFGDCSAATENMLFVDGIAHKLGDVTFHIPQKDGKDDFLSPWRITDEEGRVDLTFTPVMDRASCTSVVVIESDQHQVFGTFDGWFITDDGEKLPIENFMAFAEKVANKW
ncbi:MAG: DUF2804 domain-containing protein [Clostridiales bacterium]|nr:DUF2804 domain-containing protein [Clostridiales bacterium]